MSTFFLPGTPRGTDVDRAYAELRTRTEELTGRGIRPIRIHSLRSRRDGTDSVTSVGEPDPCSGQTVRAIFATYDGYTVIWDGGHADLRKRQIYEAIPFDQ